MEVHHHPHVEKKSFKEYLLEGLMIFLAVTMGFFAENIREHFVKKEKEEQYIKSFVKDLSNDVTELPRLIKSIQIQQMEACDSLPVLMKYISINKPANKIYFYLRGIVRQQPITAFITDRTIAQLKNAGEMRLISNQEITDSLIDYYKQVDFINVLQGNLNTMKSELEKSLVPLLDSYSYDMVSDSLDKLVIPKKSIYLRSVDQMTINKTLIGISNIRGLSKSVQVFIIRIKNKADNIRSLIINKYQ